MRTLAPSPAFGRRALPRTLTVAPAQLSRALSLTSNGVVFVSKHRWVLYANRAAIDIASSAGSIRVAPGDECRAADPHNTAVLDRLLSVGPSQSNVAEGSPAAVGVISGPSPGCRVVAAASPYRMPLGDGAEEGVVLLLRTPAMIAEDAVDTLATMFGFTVDEVCFAAGLPVGPDPGPRWPRCAGGLSLPKDPGFLAATLRSGAVSWLRLC